MRHSMLRFKLSKGFTLIELIVVMTILGILVATIATSFQTSRVKANDARRKGELKQIAAALEAYMSDHMVYPPADPNGRVMSCGAGYNTACAWGSEFRDGTGTVYMAQLPKDPKDPTLVYRYVVSADQKKYQLYTKLENAQDKDNVVTYTAICGAYACTYGISSQNTKPGLSI